MIDEVRLFAAPEPLGRAGVAAASIPVTSLVDVQVRTIGTDVLISGYVHRPR
jgi:hypothetical protein